MAWITNKITNDIINQAAQGIAGDAFLLPEDQFDRRKAVFDQVGEWAKQYAWTSETRGYFIGVLFEAVNDYLQYLRNQLDQIKPELVNLNNPTSPILPSTPLPEPVTIHTMADLFALMYRLTGQAWVQVYIPPKLNLNPPVSQSISHSHSEPQDTPNGFGFGFTTESPPDTTLEHANLSQVCRKLRNLSSRIRNEHLTRQIIQMELRAIGEADETRALTTYERYYAHDLWGGICQEHGLEQADTLTPLYFTMKTKRT